MRTQLYISNLDAQNSSGGCKSIEAQDGVALLDLSRTFQPVQSFGQFYSPVMLGDHDTLRRHKVRGVEVVQHAGQFLGLVIRRVKKKEIESN